MIILDNYLNEINDQMIITESMKQKIDEEMQYFFPSIF